MVEFKFIEYGTDFGTRDMGQKLRGTTMIGKRKVTIQKDGSLVKSDECMLRCEKVDADYSTKILGLWEGKMTSERSAYDNGQRYPASFALTRVE